MHPPGSTRPVIHPAAPPGYPQKKDPTRGSSSIFLALSYLLVLFSFNLINQRLKCAVKRLFERFGGTFYKKVVLGNMDPDLRDLVLDIVNHIVQFEKDIYFDDPVMKRV
jgi:hypothetical protein